MSDGSSRGSMARLGLRTKEQRAWAMYDWANSAMITVIVTAVYPIFFSAYAAEVFAVFEKFAGIFGPGVFALMIVLTGSSRSAILAVIVFFIAGGLLLINVDVDEGQRIAKAAEEAS